MKAYSIYDSKAEAYLTPVFMPNDGTAIRAMSDKLLENETDNNLWRHAEDYTLFRVGQWEEEEGDILGHTPISVVTVIALRSQHEAQASQA